MIWKGCFAVTLAFTLTVHGQGRLVLPSASVPAGDTLHVHGEGFAPGRVSLEMRGALAAYALPGADVGSDSTFAVAWPVPADARTGAYRLVAIADDGDEITRTDVTITEPAPVAAEPATHADHAAAGTEGAPVAHAGELPLERSRSAVEWGLIVLALAGSLVVGLR